MTATTKRFWKNRSGATVVEYALIGGILSLTILAGFGRATDALEYLYGQNESKFEQAFQPAQ